VKRPSRIAVLLPIDPNAQVAQSVEHVLGKDEVGGSIPLLGFAVDSIGWSPILVLE
jgi:hypothetical protein